jgi:major membrane immunogen (membrane-anchored lipoprotein)
MMSSLFIGCAKDEPAVEETTAAETTAAESTEATTTADGTLADGIYFASDDAFDAESGWKSVVTIEVAGGKITTVDWNGANVAAGKDKKTTSADGEYGMVEFGKASSEWHEQAALAEAYLVENQSLANLTTDAEGKTDAVAGVTIAVSDFTALVEKALAAGPVGTGKFVDGTFYAEEAAFNPENGWKENASFTVINGFVVAANWNGTSEATTKDKKTFSADGEYKMVEIGKAIAEWHEQAALVEGFLVDSQDFDAITLTDADGHTDAVAGVSMKVLSFVDLAKQALKLR